MNKNIIFFLAINLFNTAFTVEHNTKKCSFEYTVSPKDSQDLNDFNHATQKLLNLFEEAHRNPENSATFYNKLLVFIKELQEAVVAGVNLLSSSFTSTNATIETINQVAQTAENIVQAVEAVEAIQTNLPEETHSKAIEATQEAPSQTAEVTEELPTTEVESAQTNAVESTNEEISSQATEELSTTEVEPTQTNAVESTNEVEAPVVNNPKIKIITTISCDNPEKDALFEALKNKMYELAQAVNTQSCTPTQFVEMLHAIIQESKELDLAGNINIDIQG